MIDNDGNSFEKKMNKAVNRVQSLVGLPTNINIFKKFLVDPERTGGDHSLIQWPEDVAVVERMKVLETYLTSDKEGETIFVRARDSEDGNFSHNYEKRFERDGERIQELKMIKHKQYDKLVDAFADPSRKSIELLRTCFNYRTQHFVLETISNLPGQPTVLRTASDSDKIDLPSFLPIVREITGDKQYSNYSQSNLNI